MVHTPDSGAALPVKDTQWVWVVVEDPEGQQQLLGQMDEENQIAFIPAFLEKEAAQSCFLKITRKKATKYEIQAIIYEDLLRYAGENGLLIFILDEDGRILEKLAPGAKPAE
jgi:hypothetical protein